jgi:hypothetical protein
MSEAAKAFISSIVATGVGISALALSHWDSQDWVRFSVFLTLCAGAALLKGRIPGLTGTYSPLFFFLLLGSHALSFSELVVIGGLAAIVQCTFNLRQYPCLSQIEFNAANTIISTALAFAFINRYVPGLTDLPLVILLILGASVYYLVNTGLVSIVLALVESKPLASVWRRWCLASLLFYIVGALIAGAAIGALGQIKVTIYLTDHTMVTCERPQFVDLGALFEVLFFEPHMPIVQTVSFYLDESGKFHDSEVVSMGGVLAAPRGIAPASIAWNNRLEKEDLAYTSMKDAINLSGPFFNWRTDSKGEQRRDDLILDLANILAGASFNRISAFMRSEDFKRLPQNDKKLFRNDTHYAMFESCLMGAIAQMTGQQATILVACDLSEEYAVECIRLFNKLRHKKEIKERCTGILFADDERVPCLQMADMVAYCMRVHGMAGISPPHPLIQKILDLFGTQDKKEGTVLYRVGGLGLGDADLSMS